MKTFHFGAVKIVNLTDLYLTREEHSHAIRRIYRRIGEAQSVAFMACLVTGLLVGAVIEQKKRIDDLGSQLRRCASNLGFEPSAVAEGDSFSQSGKRPYQKDETAG